MMAFWPKVLANILNLSNCKVQRPNLFRNQIYLSRITLTIIALILHIFYIKKKKKKVHCSLKYCKSKQTNKQTKALPWLQVFGQVKQYVGRVAKTLTIIDAFLQSRHTNVE